MKNLLSISLFVLFVSFSSSQNKNDIVFLFENGKDTFIKNKNEDIYSINKKNHFRYTESKHKKTIINYASIKEKITSYSTFIKLNKGKKYPEFFNEYKFFIYIKESESSGCLVEVEKIWLVEEKIID